MASVENLLRSMMTSALLLLSMGSSIRAQQSPEGDVDALLRTDASQRAMWARTWLDSGDPRKVAWGAWLVRVDHIKVTDSGGCAKGDRLQSG